MSEMNKNDIEAHELKPQKRLLSWMLSKKVPPLPTPEERYNYPQHSANIFSQIFFWWLNPVMKRGYHRTLEPEDFFTLGDDIKVEAMNKTFENHFNRRLAIARAKHIARKCAQRNETPETSLVDAEQDLEDFEIPRMVIVISLWLTFMWQYTTAILFLLLANTGMTTNPLLTKKLILFVTSRAMGTEKSVGRGLGYSFGATAMVLVTGILINHFFYRSMLTGAQAKAILTKSVLAKSFRLSAKGRHLYPTGKITSMMGTDLARIDFSLGFQPFLVVFPVTLAIAIAILIVNIGVAALVGIAILIVFMIAIMVCVKQLFAFRAKANKFTDSRVNYMKEALNNLKIIKFYAWEPPYHENISEVRRKEMSLIYKMQILRNIITAFAMSLTLFASMTSFLVVYKIDSGKRTPASIFSSISLFNVLAQLVIMLPMALASGSDAYIGLTRVGKYLSAPETDVEATSIDALPEKSVEMDENGLSIEVNRASFEWESFDLADEDELPITKEKSKVELTKSQEKRVSSETDTGSSLDVPFPGLQDIDLKIRKGEFIVITGLIGSGKSSLLSALSGFMNRTQGSVAVNGSLLLCGYPWVQNATVKENIIFGKELDEERYRKVVYACSLESDLEILPAGDKTEVGERGITLSGGQKARINLARAVYADKEIVLLDDVLSAVDARVGKHIINNCFLDLMKDKTRILATHQLSLIGSADRIVFLNGDGTISVGSLEELKAKNSGFANLMAFNSESKDDDDDDEEEEDSEDASKGNGSESILEVTAEDRFEDADVKEQEHEMIARQVSKISHITEDEEAEHRNFNENNTGDGQLISQERKAVNSISLSIYANYLLIGSGPIGPYLLLPVFVFCMVLATFFQLFTNTWLSFWTELKFEGRPDKFYIGLYVAFTFLSFFFLLFEFVILVYITNTASVRLNVMAVGKILHSPMSFMDTTPMGRILNRFTKDTDVLDNEIGDQLRFFLYTFCNIIGVLIMCIIYLPWFAIAIPFLGFIFVAISNFYQSSAREIKRIEALQRSTVYNNFNETLSGMATIQAYKDDERFVTRSDLCINKMNEAYYLTIANQRWLAIHMDMVACVFALLIALLCVCRVFNISPASVGLLLSYVFQIAGQLSMLIRTFTQVENEMNSAERLNEYAFGLPEEAPYVITETTPQESWPENGCIRFDKVDLAYRPGLPLVLKNLDFTIQPHEKIGICGRTGAGKSSIMTALYRLSELLSGKIYIDDIDISTLGLKNLRSKLSIIPQDPVLFRGTIRRNLDPFNESPDDKLWDSLRRTGLIDGQKLATVKKQKRSDNDNDEDTMHKFHLDQLVDDDGANFSLGERQLIAFARALVRDSRILILDEATSSVDYETDANIQSTIVKEFGHCTILCIAHRLKTIINYDRILVLDKGEIREFDTPWNLFNSKGTIFNQMCERSNITSDDFAKVESF